eukprot:jgi/Mesvir1/23759/Mv18687-RA.3
MVGAGVSAHAPYERPALSKGYLNPEGATRLPKFHTCVGTGEERHLPDWYTEKGIDLLLGTKVVSLDAEARQVATARGDVIGYDKLIVATGMTPLRLDDLQTPGADAQGIFYLRHVVDADELYGAIKAAPHGAKAVVVGGGYIGMEGACALNKNGLDVTMVFPEDRLMARLFPPEIASFYERYYADKGVKLVKRSTVSEIIKKDDGTVRGVALQDGIRLDAQLVLVGIGSRSNLDILEGHVEMQGRGILVDGNLRSSNEHIYAAGDVATLPLALYGGERARVEHVDNARKSGAHVARVLMGEQAAGGYAYLPYFYSRVFDLAWVFYGQSKGECVTFGDYDQKKFGACWVDNGRIVGAFLEGGSADENAAMEKIARDMPACTDVSTLRHQSVSTIAKV